MNNYLQCKWVIEIYMGGREKTSHLLADPFTLVIDGWTLVTDDDGAQNLGLSSSLHNCKEVMMFSTRSLQRKQQHQQDL